MLRPLLLAAVLSAGALHAAEARVVKVLPHLLDSKGRHTLSPSLYERDAYQAQLRSHPDRVSGLRLDVLCSLPKPRPVTAVLRLELRGSKESKPVVVERPVKPGLFGRRWTEVVLEPSEFAQVGELSAWRVSIRDGDRELASATSFLW